MSGTIEEWFDIAFHTLVSMKPSLLTPVPPLSYSLTLPLHSTSKTTINPLPIKSPLNMIFIINIKHHLLLLQKCHLEIPPLLHWVDNPTNNLQLDTRIWVYRKENKISSIPL
jgi:hypothetical protein